MLRLFIGFMCIFAAYLEPSEVSPIEEDIANMLDAILWAGAAIAFALFIKSD